MSTATAHDYDLVSYWKDLTDPGKRREFVRLKPTPNTSVSTSLSGEKGWELKERVVDDVSLGGVGISVSALEARKIRIGEMVRLYISFADKTYNVHGRAVHLSKIKKGFFPKYKLGIEFVGDASLQRAFEDLVFVLHRLNEESGHRFEDIR